MEAEQFVHFPLLCICPHLQIHHTLFLPEPNEVGYNEAFKYLKDKGVIETPFVPEECEHNAHMYYIKLDNIEERTCCATSNCAYKYAAFKSLGR